MFFARGVTSNRILSACPGLFTIPVIVDGLYVSNAGFGLLEASSGSGGDFDLTENEGNYEISVTTVGAGDKYRIVLLCKVFDLTAINKIYANFSTTSGTAGAKYFTIGAVKSAYAELGPDPDDSLLDSAGVNNCKQTLAVYTSHALQSLVCDVSELEGACNIFIEIYAGYSGSSDTETINIREIILEA